MKNILTYDGSAKNVTVELLLGNHTFIYFFKYKNFIYNVLKEAKWPKTYGEVDAKYTVGNINKLQ